MKTSEPCQQTFWSETELPLTQSAAASPAKTLAMLESALALKVKGLACGESTGDLLANYDPASSSWRTSQACLVSGWEPYSETFPRSGMMLSGTVYQLPPSAPLTGGTGSGLLPTPAARDYISESCTDEYRDIRNARGGGEAPLVGCKASSEKVLAYPISGRRPGQGQPVDASHSAPCGKGKATEPVDGCVGDFWSVEPDVGRVANGVPNRSHRLKALGNAVVPQVVEIIGRAIMQAEARND
jgi:hypothetical protein